ncbi:MAG TPA: fumarylacetoacetate hydrolase family protein [Thermomicrobiales bacterium]|nr:fumarylacetoacetate hydrolase family protein [Thermomicrobiales bacterium]
MRIATFDEGRIGVVANDDTIIDVTDLLEQYDPIEQADMLPDLITHFEELRPELESRISAGGGKPLADVKLQSPLTRPTKIICMIGNFREGTDRPIQILDFFFKSPEAIVGDGDTVILPPHDASIFHHEAEIAVVMGRECKDLSEDEVMDAIFGYTVYNDVSARGLGRDTISSFLGKSFDTFAGFGPWIVTRDEIEDPYDLQITVDVNGERRQDYSTSDIERTYPDFISYISSVMTLHPGDVICCGTNHQGLGAMQDGDEVVTAISGIGAFTLYVQDDLKREWERGIDRAMAERVRTQVDRPAVPSSGGNNS